MESHKGLFNLEIQAVSSVHTQVTNCCTRKHKKTHSLSSSDHFCLSFSHSTSFLSVTIHLCSAPGQSSGAFLHPLPCFGGWGNIPAASQGGKDSREQVGTRAEAQHHLSVLLQSGASGPLPPPGVGQTLHPHHAAHAYRRPDRWGVN